jgi:hypothetical protein
LQGEETSELKLGSKASESATIATLDTNESSDDDQKVVEAASIKVSLKEEKKIASNNSSQGLQEEAKPTKANP